jgi:putative chitinase
MSLNVSNLQRAMPGLTLELAQKYLPYLRKAMLERDITTQKRAAAFLAQLGHESVSLRFFEEIWGPTKAQLTYQGRMGNVNPGDGKRYKGRGPIQLTGRNNYHLYSQLLGLPLEEKPEMAAQPDIGFRTAALFWTRLEGNRLADAGLFDTITARINGGDTGGDDRRARFRAIMALGPDAVIPVMTREEKWREELRKRRAQLKTETDASTRSFLMRRIDELKHALRRSRRRRQAKPPVVQPVA